MIQEKVCIINLALHIYCGKQFECDHCLIFPSARTSPRKTTKRGSQSGTSTRAKADVNSSDEMDTGSEEEEEEENKVKKRRVNTKAKAKPKPEAEKKVSWRDCPTVKASRVERPGEFVPANPKPKKKVK